MPTKKKSCFVISPIGQEGSEERKRADQILNYIISPVLKDLGYTVTRADKMSKPGQITRQIITQLVEADMVIADLTDHNANVFYELAVRHAGRKPVVHLIQEGQLIPFDIAQNRAIFVDHTDLDSAEKAKSELRRQVEHLESNPDDHDSPISVAVDLLQRTQTGSPEEKGNAEILATLYDLREQVAVLCKSVRVDSDLPDALLHLVRDMDMHARELSRIVDSMLQHQAGGPEAQPLLEEIQAGLARLQDISRYGMRMTRRLR